MNQAVSFGRIATRGAQATLIAFLAGTVLLGCGGGGGGGGTGIDPNGDEDLNAAFSARVVTPDGANLRGQINYPGDQDWFRFRGIQGVAYTLQIEGFPPDPSVRPDLDLTGTGIDLLGVQIVDINGATQLGNSTGTTGGTAYDIVAAGVDDGLGLNVLGDSRVVWVCPNTNDYFIRVAHRRPQTGIGAYNMRLATSQLMTIFSGEPQTQTSGRLVDLVDDEGEQLFFGVITAGLRAGRFEFLESLESVIIQVVSVFVNTRIIFPGETDFQESRLHMHFGYPDVFAPEDSLNLQEGEGHPFVVESGVVFGGSGSSSSVQDATFKLSDGSVARVPVEVSSEHVSSTGDWDEYEITLKIDAESAILSDQDGGTRAINPGNFSNEVRRTFFGWPWYYDYHAQPDFDLDPDPVAVSSPEADLYHFFESTLFASPGNIVLREGEPLVPEEVRGLSGFNIFYDTALKTFQVAEQKYFTQASAPPCGCRDDETRGQTVVQTIINPDYTPFVGHRVRVHSGGLGETGPVIIDLGTLPPLKLKTINDLVVPEQQGFRVPIRQLTDAEAVRLRDAFYGDGFYIMVTHSSTGVPLARANGLLEISTFPTLEPCSFPPCSGLTGRQVDLSTGSVQFARTKAGTGDVRVYVNGEEIGLLDRTVTGDDVPACGGFSDARTVGAELRSNTYFWFARAEDGTLWQGNVDISDGSCETILLE